MPIEEQTRSIDFSWRFNHRQGQSEVAYQLRLHQTPELGSTVSFLDPNGEISFSLPASFLNEVYEHISKYEEGTPKIARTSRTVPAVPAAPALELPSIGRQTSQRTPQSPSQKHSDILIEAGGRTFSASDVGAVDVDEELTEDEKVFIPEDMEIDLDSTQFESFSIPSKKKVSPKNIKTDNVEDRESILAERQAALEKAKTKGIKRRHTEDE